jgi:hypothetical protein
MAMSMGAECVTDCADPSVLIITRNYPKGKAESLILAEDETVLKAIAAGCKLVHVEWLLLSSRYWWRLPLDDFLVTPDKPYTSIDEEALVRKDQTAPQLENWKYPLYASILKYILAVGTEPNPPPPSEPTLTLTLHPDSAPEPEPDPEPDPEPERKRKKEE